MKTGRSLLKLFSPVFVLCVLLVFGGVLSGCGSSSNDGEEEASEDTIVEEEVIPEEEPSADLTYPIVDTNLGLCYTNTEIIECPVEGDAFYGQDAQYTGNTPSHTDNSDGTITDNVTGLMWTQEVSDYSMAWSEASDYCTSLTTGDFDDWRLPTLKELWSIRDFSQGWPWVDTDYFYLVGDGSEGAQQHSWSCNDYLVDTPESLDNISFIVNDWTGHIKAMDGNRFVRAVRGNTSYGTNDFVDNNDGTITDNATGLMWEQDDNGEGLNWEAALAYAEASTYAGYDDWRLPNIKELQSMADYSGIFPAIGSVFNASGLTNEAGNADYPYYWSGTTNPYINPKEGDDAGYYYAWYLAAGYAVGVNGEDLHGTGAVRFDTKYEVEGVDGPDAPRYYNYVRLVRDGDVVETPEGDSTTVDEDRNVVFPDGDTDAGGGGGGGEDTPPGDDGGTGDEGGPDFTPGVTYLGTIDITVTAENLEAIIGGPPKPTASDVVVNFAANDVVITEAQAQSLLDILNLL